MKGLFILISVWLAFGLTQPVHAVVGCSLSNPDQDIARLFPEMTSYRVHFLTFKTQAPEGLRALESGLQMPLDPIFETEDVPYALYIVDGEKGRLGYVFGANNRGAHSSIQLIAAIEATGELRTLTLQRIRSPSATSFRAESFLNALVQVGFEANFMPCYRDGLCENAPVSDPSKGQSKEDYRAILRGLTKLGLLKELLLQPLRNPTPRTPASRAEWIGNFRGRELVAAAPKQLLALPLSDEAFAPTDPVFIWGLGETALVWPIADLEQHTLLEMQIGNQSLLLAKASLNSNPVLWAPEGPTAFRSTQDILFEDQIYMDMQSGSQWSLSLGESVYGVASGRSIRRALGGMTLSWKEAQSTGLHLMGSAGLKAAAPPEKAPKILLVLKQGLEHPAWKLSDLPANSLLKDGEIIIAKIGSDAIAWNTTDHQGEGHTFSRNGHFFARDIATGSQWSLLSGRALSGPLKGRQLLGFVHTRMQPSAWESLFPGQKHHNQTQ
jgi:hypothetical protein